MNKRVLWLLLITWLVCLAGCHRRSGGTATVSEPRSLESSSEPKQPVPVADTTIGTNPEFPYTGFYRFTYLVEVRKPENSGNVEITLDFRGPLTKVLVRQPGRRVAEFSTPPHNFFGYLFWSLNNGGSLEKYLSGALVLPQMLLEPVKRDWPERWEGDPWGVGSQYQYYDMLKIQGSCNESGHAGVLMEPPGDYDWMICFSPETPLPLRAERNDDNKSFRIVLVDYSEEPTDPLQSTTPMEGVWFKRIRSHHGKGHHRGILFAENGKWTLVKGEVVRDADGQPTVTSFCETEEKGRYLRWDNNLAVLSPGIKRWKEVYAGPELTIQEDNDTLTLAGRIHQVGDGPFTRMEGLNTGRCQQKHKTKAAAKESNPPFEFIQAVRHGDVALVQKGLTDGLTPNERYKSTFPQKVYPLLMAAGRRYTDIVALLLEHGAEVDVANFKGETALTKAAGANGNTDIVELLLEHGAEIEARNKQGKTALARAAAAGRLQVVRLLISRGADVNARTNDGETMLDIACKARFKDVFDLLWAAGAQGPTFAFRQAVEQGRFARVKELVSHENPDYVVHLCKKKCPPELIRIALDAGASAQSSDLMMAAIASGEVDLVRRLLETGAAAQGAGNKRYVDELFRGTDDSPVALAAQKGSREIVELLVKAGADVNKPSGSGGSTPLSSACPYPEILEFLLNEGADPNLRSKKPYLLIAAMRNPESLKLLLSHGLDPNSAGQNEMYSEASKGTFKLESMRLLLEAGGQYHLKEERPLLHAAAWAGDEAMIRLLLEHHSPVDPKGYKGRTPLAAAAERNAMPVVELLIDAGASLTAPDDNGHPPLSHYVCEADQLNPAIVNKLLSAGANVQTADHRGVTPLHCAAREGEDEIVELLLSAGADVNAKDNHGGTPLAWALIYRNRAPVVRRLIAAGARPDASVTKNLKRRKHDPETTKLIEQLGEAP